MERVQLKIVRDLYVALNSAPVLAVSYFEDLIVVETEAFPFWLGAVLSRNKNDGKIHPVQYSNQAIKKLEREYSVFEWEALEVVFARKKYLAYILSSKLFMVLLDQKYLRSAFVRKDIHERLLR